MRCWYPEAAKEGSHSSTEVSKQYTVSYEEDMSRGHDLLEEIREGRETTTEESSKRGSGTEETRSQYA